MANKKTPSKPSPSKKRKSPPRLSDAGKTRNSKFGFYGTIKASSEKERLTKYTSIFNSIKKKYAKDDPKRDILTRNFLDSSHGRHIANHINDGTGQEEIANQVKGRFKRFMKDHDPKLFGESVELTEATKKVDAKFYYGKGYHAFATGEPMPRHYTAEDPRYDHWMAGNKDAALNKPHNPPEGKISVPLSAEKAARRSEKYKNKIIKKYGSLDPKDREVKTENEEFEEYDEDEMLVEYGSKSEEGARVMRAFLEGKPMNGRPRRDRTGYQDHTDGNNLYHIGSLIARKGVPDENGHAKIYGIVPKGWDTTQTRSRLGMLKSLIHTNGKTHRWSMGPSRVKGKTMFNGKEVHEGVPFVLHDPSKPIQEETEEETMSNNRDERIGQLISHAFDGEATRVSSLLDEIMKDRLAELVDVKKAEIAERIFGDEEPETEINDEDYEYNEEEPSDNSEIEESEESEIEAEHLEEKSLIKKVGRAISSITPGTTANKVAKAKSNLIANNKEKQPTGFKINPNGKMDYSTTKRLSE